MANEFITPREMVRRVIDKAEEVVKEMPLEACARLAEYEGACPMGLTGAILASLVSAARKRVAGAQA